MLGFDDRDRLLAGLADPSQVDAIRGPAPCDNCPRAAHCAVHRLACSSFSLYAGGESEVRWQAAPRAPNAEIYARLYPD